MNTSRTSLSSAIAVTAAFACSLASWGQGGVPAPAPASPAAPGAPAADAAKQEIKTAYVQFKTNLGDIVIELDLTNAPVSSENFIRYVKEGFYDGTIFHRVIPGFVIQGGGFTSDMAQKETHAGITNEWRNGLKNARGTLSMARLGGRPDSATSQFFINLVDNQALDLDRDGAAYAVFGHVVSGMEVVDKVAGAPTQQFKGHADVPKDAVTIESAKIIEKPTGLPAAGPVATAPAAPSAPTTPPATAPATGG